MNGISCRLLNRGIMWMFYMGADKTRTQDQGDSIRKLRILYADAQLVFIITQVQLPLQG